MAGPHQNFSHQMNQDMLTIANNYGGVFQHPALTNAQIQLAFQDIENRINNSFPVQFDRNHCVDFFRNLNNLIRVGDNLNGYNWLSIVYSCNVLCQKLEEKWNSNPANPLPNVPGYVHIPGFGVKQMHNGNYVLVLWRVMWYEQLITFSNATPIADRGRDTALCVLIRSRTGRFMRATEVKRLSRAWDRRFLIMPALIQTQLNLFWLYPSHWIILSQASQTSFNYLVKQAIAIKSQERKTRIANSGTQANIPQGVQDLVQDVMNAVTPVLNNPNHLGTIQNPIHYHQALKEIMRLCYNNFGN